MAAAEFFYWGGFNFFCVLFGGKKAYLIDFSLKFNEITFCNLFMVNPGFNDLIKSYLKNRYPRVLIESKDCNQGILLTGTR